MQFLDEIGGDESKREGNLFATWCEKSVASDTVTFGVPWLSEYDELLLTFPLAGLAKVEKDMKNKAVSMTIPATMKPTH